MTIDFAIELFPCQVVSFLICYLGVPLSVTNKVSMATSSRQSSRSIADMEGKSYEHEWSSSPYKIHSIGDPYLCFYRYGVAGLGAQRAYQADESVSVVRRGARWKVSHCLAHCPMSMTAGRLSRPGFKTV
jgi:hypothetical protein